jgi:hypothetical protein
MYTFSDLVTIQYERAQQIFWDVFEWERKCALIHARTVFNKTHIFIEPKCASK